MKQKLALVLLLSAACAKSSFPPPVIPPQPAVSDWPDVGAALIDDVATLEYRIEPGAMGAPSRVVATLDHRRRYKVLNELGVKAAEVDLPIDGYSRVTKLEGRIVRPDGSVLTLEPEGIQPSPWPGANSPELQRLHFRIPGAEPGGLVEYRYIRTYDNADFVPPWVFGGPFPVMRAQLDVILGPGVTIDYRFGRGEAAQELLPLRRETGDGRVRLVFVVQDLPPYYSEPDMPHVTRLAPWLMLNVTSAKLPEGLRRLETWDDASALLTSYLSMPGGNPGAGGPAERFREVRDHLRYAGVPGIGVLPPRTPQDLAAGKAVSSRDAASRLLAALQGLGIAASPALIAAPAGPPAVQGFATFAPFVRAVVAVRATSEAVSKIGCEKPEAQAEPRCRVGPNDYLFLDAACRHCRYGELPWELAEGQAAVLGRGGVEWVQLPVDLPAQHHLRLRYNVAFDTTGKVTGQVDGEATGNVAGLLRAASMRSEGDVTGVIFGSEATAALHKITILGDMNVDEPLSFKAEVETSLDKLAYESFQVRPEMLIGPAYPGAYRQVRRSDALLAAPRLVEHEVTLNLPVGYDVELVPEVRIVRPFAEYVANFMRRERTLVYTRRFALTSRRIAAQDWDAFLSFMEQVTTAEGRGVRIRVRE